MVKLLIALMLVCCTSCSDSALVEGERGIVYANNFSPGVHSDGPWVVYVEREDGIISKYIGRENTQLRPGDKVVAMYDSKTGELRALKKIGRTHNFLGSL